MPRTLPRLVAVASLVVSTNAWATQEFPVLPQPKACLEVNADYTGDACADDFASSEAEFCFADRVPSDPSFHSRNPNDGQIAVLGNDDDEDCAVVLVKETGYYALFDTELSESCADQKDETGYLTVHNSCNGEGWAVERNAGERYLVLDADNEGAGCQADAECGADEVCREGNNHGTCCVPAEPVYMGTFLLSAGEENVVCIHHWCPEWKNALNMGQNMGFVHDATNLDNNCSSADSIHFNIAASAFVCKQESFLQACAGGCNAGDCLPHPCMDADCPNHCVMGADGAAECVDENPCLDVQCGVGCAYGLCLQGEDARGEDRDGDGWSELADCDDDDASRNPGLEELCDNGKDDDCDGFVDECGPSFGAVFDDEEMLAGGADPNADAAGCGCSAVGAPGQGWAAWGAMVALLGLAARRRN